MTVEIDKDLVALHRAVLSMGAVARERVSQAFRSLLDHDVALATIVREGDREIDEMELDIDEECLKILALQGPVAGDLRYVLAILRINQDLERIADFAKSIAKRVIDMQYAEPVSFPPMISLMANATEKMLADALRSLADRDAELAKRVRRDDQYVDERNREVFTWAIDEVATHGDQARSIIDIVSAARSIERIADLSTNIAEDVVFAVGGEVLRHKPPA
jgi:phosphate transport system protein